MWQTGLFLQTFRQSNLHYTNAQTNPVTSYMIANDQSGLSQMNYHQDVAEEVQPPPMIPIKQFLADGGVLNQNFNIIRHQQQAQRMVMDVVNQNSGPR